MFVYEEMTSGEKLSSEVIIINLKPLELMPSFNFILQLSCKKV
jgi:hypothetical protein